MKTPVFSLPLRLMLGFCALLSCNRPDARERFAPVPANVAASSSASMMRLAPVTIHSPLKLTAIKTNEKDAMGNAITVQCSTCHSMRKPEVLPTSASDLKSFHVGLKFKHGTLTCGSCHSNGDQMSLHAADGKKIPNLDVMQLCKQCHGPQFRDYENGLHGGMNGYWDRTRGERVRNNCVDCHDSHTPKFQPTMPVLKPKDRFLSDHSSHQTKSHGERHD